MRKIHTTNREDSVDVLKREISGDKQRVEYGEAR